MGALGGVDSRISRLNLVPVLHTSGKTMLKCINKQFDQNMTFSSRVMSIFTNSPRPAGLMLDAASSPFLIPVS